MNLSEFANNAALLLSHGLRRAPEFTNATSDAYKAMMEDHDALIAFKRLLHETGLDMVHSQRRNNFVLVPTDANSIFAVGLTDLRRQLGSARDGDVKAEILGFVIMAVVASFYPTRESLTYARHNPVRKEDVFKMLESLIEFGVQRPEQEGDARLSLLAHELQQMPEQDGNSRRSQFREFYVNTALKLLEDQKLVQIRKNTDDKEPVYQATERLREICIERINADTLQMSEILNRFYNQNEPA